MYELRKRGSQGRTPWTFDLGANVTFDTRSPSADLQVKLAVYNLLNQQRMTEVDEICSRRHRQPRTTDYRLGTGYQSPRYATADRSSWTFDG